MPKKSQEKKVADAYDEGYKDAMTICLVIITAYGEEKAILEIKQRIKN